MSEDSQPLEARELADLARAGKRVLDGQPARSPAWGGLEGELVLPCSGTRGIVAIREADSVPRHLNPEDRVIILEEATPEALEIARLLWTGGTDPAGSPIESILGP